jgi:hypothetical protein
MVAHDTAEALRHGLVEFRNPVGATARDGLQQAVWTYAAERKAEGWPPERVIVELKSIAREELGSLKSLRLMPPSVRLETSETLVTDMVGWCVDQYYQDTAW